MTLIDQDRCSIRMIPLCEAGSVKQMSLTSWILRLVTWDGLLPAVVWLIPYVVGIFFPNMPGVIEFFGVAVPIAAFWIRFHVGQRFISSNHCGTVMRAFQLGIFFIGILVLVLVDTIIILAHSVPAGVRLKTREDAIVIVVMFALYFLAMAFAMYPGYDSSLKVTHESDRWPNLNGDASNQ
jgi:hypothetical protein